MASVSVEGTLRTDSYSPARALFTPSSSAAEDRTTSEQSGKVFLIRLMTSTGEVEKNAAKKNKNFGTVNKETWYLTRSSVCAFEAGSTFIILTTSLIFKLSLGRLDCPYQSKNHQIWGLSESQATLNAQDDYSKLLPYSHIHLAQTCPSYTYM